MTEITRPTNRKANVNEEHKEEAARLSKIWRDTPHETQAVFGEMYEVGTQSAVGQFLRGESPLSLKAARGFATGLGCRISDFSPRLAKEAEQLSGLVSPPDGPAAELVRRMSTASPDTLAMIEIALLESDPVAAKKLSPSLVNLVRAVKETIKAQQGSTNNEQMDFPNPG